MKKKSVGRAIDVANKNLRPVGRQVLDIPLGQLIPDPHQPRDTFNEEALHELAASIKNQGLQQFPTVNFTYFENGKPYYILKTGERRWRAHKLLGYEMMTCVVEATIYDGVRTISRRLAQAAENSSREPHTHKEIVNLVEEVVREEQEKRGQIFGSVSIALTVAATAFGKSTAWAMNYHTLSGLIPELRNMLDEEDEGKRLNFSIGLALARAPADEQKKLFSEAMIRIKKNGHHAGYQFIVQSARFIRESRGEKVRGAAYDEKVRFIKFGTKLNNLSVMFSGDRKSGEHSKYMDDMISRMSSIEVDAMLSDVNQGMVGFKALQDKLKERRAANYEKLGLKRA